MLTIRFEPTPVYTSRSGDDVRGPGGGDLPDGDGDRGFFDSGDGIAMPALGQLRRQPVYYCA